MVDLPTAGIVAALAFDLGIYAKSSQGAKGDLERLAEPLAFLTTAAAIAFVLLLGGRPGGALLVTALWSRAGWDALHLGDGNVLAIDLPRDYALYSLVVKGALSGLYLVFALPR